MTIFAFKNPSSFDDARTLYMGVVATPLRPADETALTRSFTNENDYAFAKFAIQWQRAFPDQKCAGMSSQDGNGIVPNRHALRMLGAYNIGGPQPHTVRREDLLEKLHDINNVMTKAMLIGSRPAVAARVLGRS